MLLLIPPTCWKYVEKDFSVLRPIKDFVERSLLKMNNHIHYKMISCLPFFLDITLLWLPRLSDGLWIEDGSRQCKIWLNLHFYKDWMCSIFASSQSLLMFKYCSYGSKVSVTDWCKKYSNNKPNNICNDCCYFC